MKNAVKSFLRDLSYIFINYFVNNIPFWCVRRFIYICIGMKIGKGSRICMKCIIMSPWKIKIGENTMVNEYSLLDGRGGLEIGNSCSISMWAVIYTASHISSSDNFQYYAKKTIIKDCCWLGTRSVIMPGSILNDFTIVSVNSCFKGISKKKGIYMGNPAAFSKYRDIEESYDMCNLNFFK